MLRVVAKPGVRLRCPACHGDLGGWVTRCGRCRTDYHRDCAEDLGDCAVLGCSGRVGARRRPRVPTSSGRPSPAPARRRWRLVQLLLAGLLLIGFAPEIKRFTRSVKKTLREPPPRQTNEVEELMALAERGGVRSGYRYSIERYARGRWVLFVDPIHSHARAHHFAVNQAGERRSSSGQRVPVSAEGLYLPGAQEMID